MSEAGLHAALARGGEHHHGAVRRVPLDHAKHPTRHGVTASALVVEVLLCMTQGRCRHLEEEGVTAALVGVPYHDAADGHRAVGLVEGEVLGVQPLCHVLAVGQCGGERDDAREALFFCVLCVALCVVALHAVVLVVG